MALELELEQTIMREIGLGNHYTWFNGSGSCAGIARQAVQSLVSVAKKHNLSINSQWMAHCYKAVRLEVKGVDVIALELWLNRNSEDCTSASDE